MTKTALPTVYTRAAYYVPVEVKKAIQQAQADDPRPTPPSENSLLIALLEMGLAAFYEMPTIATAGIYRIDKQSTALQIVGLRLPASLHEEMKQAAAQVVQRLQPGQEPATFRYIDLGAHFFKTQIEFLNVENF